MEPVRDYDVLPKGSSVLCAVSGGADSVCLLHWLSRQKDLTLRAAHFNHLLREAEAHRDEQFVRDLCGEWSIPLTIGRGDVRSFARQEKRSIEEAARTLRYTFLFRTAEAEGCDLVVTAHNAGDNAETLLLHLLRGSGLHGLSGISPKGNRLARPFLTTSRAEIEAYLEQHHLPHVEDSSNAGDTYTRNRVRHQLIPLLEEMNPGFVRRLTSTIPRLRADDEYLNTLAWQLFRSAKRRGEDLVIPARAMADAPAPVASRAVRLLLAEAAEGDWDCSAPHIEAVLSLCRSQAPSAQVSLPRQLTARREYELLVLTHEPAPGPLPPMALHEGENPVPGTGWTVCLEGPPWPGLVVRSRQTGDALTLPSGHRRSLKKLFIDQRIPRLERDTLPVVADGAGVIAVAGVGLDLRHPHRGKIAIISKERGEEP